MKGLFRIAYGFHPVLSVVALTTGGAVLPRADGWLFVALACSLGACAATTIYAWFHERRTMIGYHNLVLTLELAAKDCVVALEEYADRFGPLVREEAQEDRPRMPHTASGVALDWRAADYGIEREDGEDDEGLRARILAQRVVQK